MSTFINIPQAPSPTNRSRNGSNSNASTPSNRTNPKTILCTFFAQGTCRFGNDCRYSHDPTLATPPKPSSTNSSNTTTPNATTGPIAVDTSAEPGTPPKLPSAASPANPLNLPIAPYPPMIVNLPQNQPVYSIDVECVATGIQHNARAIAQVALVDAWSRPVFIAYIKQDKPVVSYLTELTGLNKEVLEKHGLPLAEAMAQLRSFLSPNAVLVGQSIHKDVQWLQLAQGIDYHSLINLADLFKVYNIQHGNFTNFSQDHVARVWLGISERHNHDAVTDAAISMSLFNAYRTIQYDANRLFQLQCATFAAPRIPGFSASHPVIDGCCMGNRKKCICGAPFE